MKTKVGFIGFGLIAGSLAHALKESGRDYHITATSRHLEPVIAAVADDIVDVAAPAVDETFAQCDIILLCTPVITITEYLTKLKVIASPDCIITDVGSVKTIIHEAADSLGLNDRFIGGHPMAGSEKTGYENSGSSIIKGARYIITPTKETKPEKIELMKSLIRMRIQEDACRSLYFDFPHKYSQKRCVEYRKLNLDGKWIEVLLNCGSEPIEIQGQGEILFARRCEGNSLDVRGTLIRRLPSTV